MGLKEYGISLCVTWLLPKLGAILKSAISKIAKNLYERLYKRFKAVLESYEKALNKLSQTDDPKKLKKRLNCCVLGHRFLTDIFNILNDVLPEYEAIINSAGTKYYRLTGESWADDILEGE